MKNLVLELHCTVAGIVREMHFQRMKCVSNMWDVSGMYNTRVWK